MRRLLPIAAVSYFTVAGMVLLTPSEPVKAQAQLSRASATTRMDLLGGPRGVVKSSKGHAVSGLMVQLISQETSIRTTVYTDELGQYEFPKLETGVYALRIPRPLEFRPYVTEGVHIDGATRMDDIIVERVTESEFIPPTPELFPQLTPAEWIANMPGTAQEKRVFLRGCSPGCHSLDYAFRAKLDEASWPKLLNRMIYYGGRMAINPSRSGNPGYMNDNAEAAIVTDWLSRIRSLDSEYPPIKPFPRPHGPATRAIVTEFELPWTLGHVHDVVGDADGNIWFTENRNPLIGKLDPKTGKIISYRIPSTVPPPLHPEPDTPIEPGLHWIDVDRHTGALWFSWNWAGSLGRLDPRTGDIRQVYTGVSGNLALAPDGQSIWKNSGGKIQKFDVNTVLETGKPVKEWPLKSVRTTYGNFFSWDGRYFGGAGGDIVWFDTETEELREVTSLNYAGSGRGGFDPEGNIWAGGKTAMGGILKYDPKTGAAVEYVVPTPHVNTYSARADKNGEVWAGEMQGGRIARFNPRTHQWIEYVLPTATGGFDFNSWIDNSTDPPTYWYGDNYGYIVRIQPLE